MKTQGGMRLTCLAKEDEDLRLCLGKDEETWACAQRLDPPALGIMGALERLDNPIGTPMKRHAGRLKEKHKARVPKVGVCRYKKTQWFMSAWVR
jgi:hypothetical protein